MEKEIDQSTIINILTNVYGLTSAAIADVLGIGSDEISRVKNKKKSRTDFEYHNFYNKFFILNDKNDEALKMSLIIMFLKSKDLWSSYLEKYQNDGYEMFIKALLILAFSGVKGLEELDDTKYNYDNNYKYKYMDDFEHVNGLLAAYYDSNKVINKTNFFKGFEAEWDEIFFNIPVNRGILEEVHNRVCSDIENLNNSMKLKGYMLTGPKGVGKTTIAKQLCFLLAKNGHYTTWFDNRYGKISKDIARELGIYTKKQRSDRRVHFFIRISMDFSDEYAEETIMEDFISLVKTFKDRNISLYIVMESNHFQRNRLIIDKNFEVSAGSKLTVWNIPLDLRGQEIEELIQKLDTFNSLGNLEGRPFSEIRTIFERKANKVLLVALIEALYARDKEDNFGNVLFREFMELPPKYRNLYSITSLCDKYGVQVPESLLERILDIDYGTLSEVAGLKDIIKFNRNSSFVSTRHRIIAKTLCDVIYAEYYKNENNESNYWSKIISQVFQNIELLKEDHKKFIFNFALEKAASILYVTEGIQSLNFLVNELSRNKFMNLDNDTAALLINMCARIFQANKQYDRAIEIAELGEKISSTQAVYSLIIMMFCYSANPKDHEKIVPITREIINKKPGIAAMCSAINVLIKCGYYKEAREQLNHYESIFLSTYFYKSINKLINLADENAEIIKYNSLTDDDKARNIRRQYSKGQITKAEAEKNLRSLLEKNPCLLNAFGYLCHLLFAFSEYDEIIKLCDSVINKDKQIPENNKYKARLFSMVYCTKAWALFKQNHYDRSKWPEIERFFNTGLIFNPDNAWGHNWRGLFLFLSNEDYDNAEREISQAIEINSKLKNKVPAFYYNLSRIIFKNNSKSFSKVRNNSVIENCKVAINYCLENPLWDWKNPFDSTNSLVANLLTLQYFAEQFRDSQENTSIDFDEDLFIDRLIEDDIVCGM